MKRIAFIVLLCLLFSLSGCIYFIYILQPYVFFPNQTVPFNVNVTTEGGDYEPYFGVCLPIGWTVAGDSIKCGGAYDEVIYYDSLISLEQDSISPAQAGYYWWAGKGAVDTSAIGYVSANIYVQTDSQIGRFFIDYMLGDSYNGVNQQRSNDHQIDIVDEFTPYRLQVAIMGESIVLSWKQPYNPAGLLGYNVYRDGQQINPVLITKTTYTDENPLEGIHYYSLSSFYNNGNEYLLPYELPIMYGNQLYVSPYGNNSNSGSSFNDALLTIDFALSALNPDSLNHKTIYLSEGNFSPSTTGEIFPLKWKNYVSLKGISKEETLLDADSLTIVLQCDSITDAKFENLTIMNGYNADGYGGGIYCFYSNPEFINIKVQNNFAQYSGGGIMCFGPSPKLINVEIMNNRGGSGGGISCSGNTFLENVTIANNYAINNGGGISCGGNTVLKNVIVTGNFAQNSGGGIYCGGTENPVLENVIVADNFAAQFGGGIYCNSSTPLLLNITMTGNSAGDDGGGIYCRNNSNPILKNCILWGDSLVEIYFSTSSNPSTITISYSDIQGGEAGILTNGNGTVNWFEGNMDEDPLFENTTNHPYILSDASLCQDAGDPNPIYNDPENPSNPGYALWPAKGTILNDMGAYGGSNTINWIVTGIEDDGTEELKTPTDFELAQNYPNPFNPSTTIQYSIKERSSVEMVLYDILGRQVEVLINEEQDVGYYKLNFNAGRLASGIYFYRLQAGDFVETRKMVLLR